MAESDSVTPRELFRGSVVRLEIERVELPNGEVTEFEIVRHVGAAAIVPVLATGEVLLVRQYRHATGGWLLEIPAGKLDVDEAPEECGRRELEEETGYRAGRLVPLGTIWTTPGFCDERIWLFLATDLTQVAQRLETDEVLTVERLPLSRAVELATRSEIADSKTICGLLRAAALLGVGDA